MRNLAHGWCEPAAAGGSLGELASWRDGGEVCSAAAVCLEIWWRKFSGISSTLGLVSCVNIVFLSRLLRAKRSVKVAEVTEAVIEN